MGFSTSHIYEVVGLPRLVGELGWRRGLSLGLLVLGAIAGIGTFFLEVTTSHKHVQSQGTIVYIAANDEESSDWEYAGKVRIIWAFDTFGNVLGSSDLDQNINSGQIEPIEIHQTMGEGADAKFIDIIAHDDEICISYITAKMPTPGREWSWFGDVGASCGQAWEYGAVSKGRLADGSPYYPKCTWMDTDQGADIEVEQQPITNRQMKINMMAYGANLSERALPYLCGATIFSWDTADPIDALPEDGPSCPACDPSKANSTAKQNHARRSETWSNVRSSSRTRSTRSQMSADRLIVNSRKSQSAVELCNSPTSRGSDFASTNEGLFCDMSTKTLHPLCSNTTVSDCFDLEAGEMQLRKRGSDDGRTDPPEHQKRYKRISHWD